MSFCKGERGYAVYGYPVGTDTTALSEVRCSGVEQTLSECQIGDTASTSEINCEHREDVQLVCLPPELQPGEGKKTTPEVMQFRDCCENIAFHLL